jgi:hypothetical protein
VDASDRQIIVTGVFLLDVLAYAGSKTISWDHLAEVFWSFAILGILGMILSIVAVPAMALHEWVNAVMFSRRALPGRHRQGVPAIITLRAAQPRRAIEARTDIDSSEIETDFISRAGMVDAL